MAPLLVISYDTALDTKKHRVWQLSHANIIPMAKWKHSILRWLPCFHRRCQATYWTYNTKKHIIEQLIYSLCVIDANGIWSGEVQMESVQAWTQNEKTTEINKRSNFNELLNGGDVKSVLRFILNDVEVFLISAEPEFDQSMFSLEMVNIRLSHAPVPQYDNTTSQKLFTVTNDWTLTCSFRVATIQR